MIVVYPMLVSKAVGGNIIPGISKMLENYLVVYNMNDILGNIKTARKINYKIRGKKLFEGDYSPVVIEEADDDWMEPGTKKPKPKPKPEIPDDYKISKEDDYREREQERKEKEFEYRKKQDADKATADKEKARAEDEEKKKLKAAGKKSASADPGDMKGIALEPTFIKIKMQDGRTDFIGVKVVPIRVKSDAKLSHLLANDLSFGFIRSSLIGVGRKILRWFYLKIGRNIDTPTGDARKDMFYARTGLKGNAFVILDKDEDIDATLYSNPKLVVKLFGLSWGNMILADDINRRAYFCMKKFKGICSMIPYSMLYQALGQKQVFDDLEDARQKSGALFKRKGIKLQRVVGEHYAHLKLSDYQILGEDSNHGKNR